MPVTGNSWHVPKCATQCKMHLHPYSLDFAKDDVHVGEGDALAVDHAAVLAKLGPVLAVHVLAGGTGVPVDGEAPERLL